MWLTPLRRAVRLLARHSQPGRRAARGTAAACFRPRLEQLEDLTLLSASALDPGFGTGGKVTTNFQGRNTSAAQALAVVQADGKMVVVGHTFAGSEDFALARYNADGNLDTAFGTGGRVTTDFGGNDDQANAVALQSDGKIVVAGFSNGPTAGPDFALARYNADGSLDTTFGSGGRVTTDFSNDADYASAVTVQADGKIVAAGYSYGGATGYDFALARYNADGSLDATFDGDGKVTTDFAAGDDVANAVALLADGKILVAGSSDGTSFAVTRYNIDGTLDATFGGGGKVTTDFSSTSDAQCMAVQSDGQIVVAGTTSAGYSTGYDFALVRYTSIGGLDTGFDGDGIVTTHFGSDDNAGTDSAYGVAVQSDGKIVVAGSTESSDTGSDFALARYNPDGTLDAGFGSGGRVATDFGSSGQDGATAVALQADGKVLAAGCSSTADFVLGDFAVARYNPDGTLDDSFGTAGQVTTQFIGSTQDLGQGLVVAQSDGKIIVAGSSGGAVDPFALARYNADGSPDTNFGTGGRVVTDFGSGTDVGSAVALQADGKIVVVGFGVDFRSSTGTDFVLERYNADGSLDTTFGGGGKVTTDFASLSDYATGVAVQSDGKIVVAGYCYGGATGFDFALARYNADGTLDATFGSAGEVTTDFAAGDDFAAGVTLQADGKIVVAGHSNSGGSGDFELARYNTDGTLDATFGSSGEVTTDFAGGTDFATAVALQADGKIVVAGFTVGFSTDGDSSSGSDFALARYNPDGSPDATFGSAGEVTTDFAAGYDFANAVALQADGKIVVAGASTSGVGNNDFALARYNADGGLDTTFDGDGKVTTDFGSSDDQAKGVAVQADGKIVAAGYTHSSGTGYDFALVRYLGDNVVSPDVYWDGDAGDFRWDDPLNWSTNQLPTAAQNVFITVPGITVLHPVGTDAVRSLHSVASLSITGGSLSVAAASDVGGTLSVSGATFTGAGDLTVNGALELTGGTVDGAGALILNGDVTAHAADDPSVIDRAVFLGATRMFTVEDGTAADDLRLTGTVSGATGAGLTKDGTGTLRLEASNDYSGVTDIRAGVVEITDSQALGSTAAGTNVAAGAALHVVADPPAEPVSREPLALAGSGPDGLGALVSTAIDFTWGGDITLTADAAIACTGVPFTANLTIDADVDNGGFELTVGGECNIAIGLDPTLLPPDRPPTTGAIRGRGGLTKVGIGNLTLQGGPANTYTGTTTVSQGGLLLNKDGIAIPGALVIGSPGGATATVVAKNFPEQIADTAPVTVFGQQLRLNQFETLASLTVVGGDVESFAGMQVLGSLDLTGHMDVNYPGVSVGGDVTVSDRAHLDGWVLLDRPGQAFIIGGGLRIDAIIDGNGGLTKEGPGWLELSAPANLYTGATVVNAGTLLVNGSETESPITVNAGATLSGTGTAGTITANGGTVSPGNPADSKGILAGGQADFSAGTVTIQVSGYATPGVDYDQLDLRSGTGLVLGGTSTLTLDLGGLAAGGTAQGILLFNSAPGEAPRFSDVKLENNPYGFTATLVYTDTDLSVILTTPTPPMLDPIPDQTVAEGSLLAFTAVAHGSDPAAKFVYSLRDAPPDATIDPVTGAFSWTPPDGPSSVQFSVVVTVDGAQSLRDERSVNVAVTNVAPNVKIGGVAKVIVEGDLIDLTSSVSDPSPVDTAHGFLYDWRVTGPTGKRAGRETSQNFSFTAADSGDYTVTLTVWDKDGDQATAVARIHVDNVPPTPRILGLPLPKGGVISTPEGTALALTASATDPSSVDTARGFSYAWTVTRDGALFDRGKGAKFTFRPDDNGAYVITLTATDKDHGTGTTSVPVTVTNVAPMPVIHGLPKVLGTDGNPTSPEGTRLPLTASATDPSKADTAAGFTFDWSVTRDGKFFGRGKGAKFAFTPNDNGTYVITLTATDKDGDSGSVSRTVTVTNVAPTPVIHGLPKSLGKIPTSPEGKPIALSATSTDPSTADTAAGFSYSWSVDNDRELRYAVGKGANFTFTPDDDGTYVVSLTATDKDHGQTVTRATISVVNVAPTLTLSGPASADGVRGQPRTFTLSAADPSPVDQAAGFTFKIDWGDKSKQPAVTGLSGTTLDHVYTAAGTFVVSVTATDKDRGTSTTTTTSITIAAVELQDGGATLAAGGTTRSDTIIFSPADAQGGVRVTINGVDQGTFLPTGRIVAYGQAGNDSILLVRTGIGSAFVSIGVPAVFFGGAGKDALDVAESGSSGNILVGGDGDDTLVGNGGRDVLIGGGGSDTVFGGAGEDVLIGGTTDFDANVAALLAIADEWGRTDADASTRAYHLNTGRGGLNGSFGLNVLTVHDDGAIDDLVGGTSKGSAHDLYVATTAASSGAVKDLIEDVDGVGIIYPLL
jgi:uncharacterized delta-60 repeat protein